MKQPELTSLIGLRDRDGDQLHMGRREQTANYFGKRVKAERERRGWSQSQMAKLLSDNKIPMIHASTIAKIELGSRPTSIDEAIGIADQCGSRLGLRA